MNRLYVEVMYTIENKLGANCPQYNQFSGDLLQFAQEAFGVSHVLHDHLKSVASDEKPPIVVLNVTVIEAEGLEAKDANGLSDPYCMLGIRLGRPNSASNCFNFSGQVPGELTDAGARSSSLASDADSSENGEDWISPLPENKSTKKHSRFTSHIHNQSLLTILCDQHP